ncbi:MAG: hypothetical protein JRH16_09375 [Deltaproteobacteria bacterium]|nr:hypothetical protein [Deltaproteobacteria bacterium]
MRVTRCVFACLALLLMSACQQLTNPTIVDQQTFSASAGSLNKLAVMPFAARAGVVRDSALIGVTDEQAADLVARFAAEALHAEGLSVVPASDMAAVFANQGRAVPRRDAKRAAEVAGVEFGATSVLMGQLVRWRERRGEALGAEHPASVAFQMTLHEVPTGRRLWTSRFDHTQRTLTADPLVARKYPGRGTRFLTGAQLARWGMRDAVTSLVKGQWRPSN